MMQRTSRSMPVVSTPTLQMMRVWPSESDRRFLPVFAGGRSVHVLRGDARLHEALCDMLRVTAIDAKAERRAPLSALEPSLDNVAGDDGLIHRLGELALVEISRDGFDPGEVGSLGAKAMNLDRKPSRIKSAVVAAMIRSS